MASVKLSKHTGSWQSRRSAASRQVEDGYTAWLKRRKDAGKAPITIRRPRYGHTGEGSDLFY